MTRPEGPRLTGGTARGRRLFSVPGLDVRPALARMRVSLFEILRPRLEGARVVDLFAGTGCLGFEALSRGAASVRFFDVDSRSVDCVRRNLDRLGFAGRGDVVQADAFKVAERLEPADVVLVDPPYAFYRDRGAEMRGLVEGLLARAVARPAGLLISEHRLKQGLGDVAGAEAVDVRTYGDTVVTFYAPR